MPDQRTSKFTVLPAITFCPGVGACVTIMLAAPGWVTGIGGVGTGCTSAGGTGGTAGTTVTFPILIPASCSAKVTLPSGCPTKFGITYDAGSGPRLTSRLIFGTDTPLAFAGGLCETTWSAG